MNTTELFNDIADGEECQISQPTVPGVKGLRSRTIIRRFIQYGERVGCDLFKHPAALDFFGNGRNDALPLQIQVGDLFGSGNDLGNVKGLFRG